MSEHDYIRKLMPLAGTGEITSDECERVSEHLARCEQCRQVNEDYAFLGSALRGLPTPQPSAELMARVRAMAGPILAQKQTRDRDEAILAPLVAASWIVAVATWPLVQSAGTWLLAGWHLPGGSFGTALTAYSILGFLLACVAAIAVGRHASANGRIQ